MKKLLPCTFSLVAAVLLPGCLQSLTTVTLRKDGSGTLVEETKFGPQATAMFAQLSQLGGGEAKDPLSDMVSEEKAKARAAELGEGVTVVKIEKIDANGSKGGRVTFGFADINKLRVATGSSLTNAMPQMPGAPPQPKPAAEDAVTFTYAGGKLVIKNPEPKKPEGAPANTPKPTGEMMDAQLEMMKGMFADMRVTMNVVVEPGIASSDASHVTGNTITLVDMDFAKIVGNDEALKKLMSLEQQDPAAALEAAKGIQGMTAETKREVTVTVD